jgi:hypothetical protein
VRWHACRRPWAGAWCPGYHVLIERFPSFESGPCDPINPRSIIGVERLGYLTIPSMALSGHALIAILLVLAKENP